MIDDRSSLEDIAFEICTAMRARGATMVLTGGSAATYYAPEVYQSRDLDFVIEFLPGDSHTKQVMIDLGFQEEFSRWFHVKNPLSVDFLEGPIAIGDDESVGFGTVRRGDQILYVLSATDSVRDRLAWFYMAKDYSALGAAIGVAKAQAIDLEIVRKWSIREGYLEKFEEFFRLLNAKK